MCVIIEYCFIILSSLFDNSTDENEKHRQVRKVAQLSQSGSVMAKCGRRYSADNIGLSSVTVTYGIR